MEDLVIERCGGFQTVFADWESSQPSSQLALFDATAVALKHADMRPDIACTVFFGAPRCLWLGAAGSGMAEAFFRTLINARKPLIAAIDGGATGVGMAMLGHFDVVFATPASVFKAPFADWGLTPEGASSLLLPEALGYRKAFEIFCLGGELTAVEAERFGLITRVVERKDLHASALEAAARIARLPPRALATTRELLRHQRSKLIRRAQTEAAVRQELPGDFAAQQHLNARDRTTGMGATPRIPQLAEAGPEGKTPVVYAA
jgi:enoyl-CoA hydratase/carnithine racemase